MPINKSSYFSCQVLHDSLKNGKATAQLMISDNYLCFSLEDKTINLFFEDLVIRLGGANDSVVFISHPSHPDWLFYTDDLSILKNAYLLKYPHLTRAIGKAQRKSQLSWVLLSLVLVFLITTPVIFLLTLDVSSKLVIDKIPVEWEKKLGEASLNDYLAQSHIMDEKKTQQFLAPLVAPLLGAIDNKHFDYHFYISKDEELNAFALPGGFVVIHSALILKAQSVEELLGVVGHEIIHVKERHGMRNIISGAGAYLLVSTVLGDMSGVLALLMDAAPMLINQAYSRDYETEADLLGLELMEKAKINPNGLVTFFTRLMEKEQEQAGNSAQWLSYLSSHPATEQRIEQLKLKAQSIQGPFINQSVEFARLKQQVALFAK